MVVNAGKELPPDDNIIEKSPQETVDTIQIKGMKTRSNQSPHKKEPVNPAVGKRVESFWPDDNALHKGQVFQITECGQCLITYDDEYLEELKLSSENWRYESSANAASGDIFQLPSVEQRVSNEIIDVFRKKPFLRHQALRFVQFPVVNTYRMEE